MDPTLILAAFVRLISLTYVANTITMIPNLWTFYNMARQYPTAKAINSAYGGIQATSVQIATHLIIAAIFWFLAVPLSKFLLKSLKGVSEKSAVGG